jgi:hypothetical protein
MIASIRWGVPQAINEDTVGSAIGDAIANAVGESYADGAGSCVGDATCSGGIENGSAAFEDGAGSAIGDAVCQGALEDATPPVVVTPPAPAIETFAGAWAKPVRKPKKKQKKLLDLDELIAELKSRIVEIPEPLPDIERTLRVSQAIAYNSDNVSFQEINNQIALLREAIEEIDDEEVIMLLAA